MTRLNQLTASSFPPSHLNHIRDAHQRITTESLDTRLLGRNTQHVDSLCVCVCVLGQISVTFMHHFIGMNRYYLQRLCAPAALCNIHLDSCGHRSLVPVSKFENVKKLAGKTSVNGWKLQCEITFSSAAH